MDWFKKKQRPSVDVSDTDNEGIVVGEDGSVSMYASPKCPRCGSKTRYSSTEITGTEYSAQIHCTECPYEFSISSPGWKV